MQTYDIRDAITDALEHHNSFELTWKTFKEAGVLTNNEGLILTSKNGRQEFQITIVKSKS
jgi:hypothetical protein